MRAEVSNNAYRFDGVQLWCFSRLLFVMVWSSLHLFVLYNDTFTPMIASRPYFIQGRKQHLTSALDQHVLSVIWKTAGGG